FVDSLDAKAMRVSANRELHTKDGAQPSERSTRHIELELPDGVTCRAGDHLGVIAHNSPVLVERVAARFGFERDGHIRLGLRPGRKSFIPVDQTIRLSRLLGDYVELQDVATRKQIESMALHTECPFTRPKLLALAGDEGRYKDAVLAPRKSVIDLLEEFPACQLPFNVYLEMLPPLRPRYYSISSSPAAASTCQITVGVVRDAARSGKGIFSGVASGHLADSMEGSTVFTFVRKPAIPFHPPANPH